MVEPRPDARPRPSRRTLTLIVAPIIVLVTIGTIGNAIHPALLKTHPMWLVAMEPRTRYLLLVANRGVAFVPYVVVAVIRRLLSDPLFFLLGYLYGDNAVAWVERRFDNNSGLVRGIERLFRRAAPVMVFLFPGPLVCVLAGATGMHIATFAVFNVIGTFVAVVFYYYLAETIKGPLDAINGFYSHNFKWLLVLSVLLTLYWLWDQRRKGKGPSLADAEEALDGDD
ncbi:MAG: VTT domain-containing protein [Actinobacteria bacterium]|nr:VTT domain-containing protein [Actinomycetota bacterium]